MQLRFAAAMPRHVALVRGYNVDTGSARQLQLEQTFGLVLP